MRWDPAVYESYAGPRLRPVLDLIGRIPLEAPARIWDLGCGTGSGTHLLARRWPEARVTGLDSSPDMLARAAAQAEGGRIDWQRGDIASWHPDQPPDLIFSNAALQWLDGHERLFPRLFGTLAPGGVLAVQMPRNHAAPSHQAILDAVRSGPWRQRLTPLLRVQPVAEPARYHDWLSPLAAGLDLWETEYLHVLSGEDPVLNWMSSTALAPFLQALDGAERDAFRADCAARLREAYPPGSDGKTLFPFRRLFLLARKAQA
ncbi:methyltransferase domain-containing protein [Telmatospirillum sp. J64-1]|uniref:methyltransferase domain-containing protein n=1 Tax=Telmatospirillum sp. J64-1 TaxID=2502183 RepID=UPI00115F687F|nr:methyltransferase domain-containing protein [Telmatospirillum sp. J64-1]